EAFDTEEDGVGGRQSEWWELAPELTKIDGQYRTSLVVDPADGQLPYNEAGRRLVREGREIPLAAMAGPEVRPSPERCLTAGSGAGGAPMFPARYNGHYHIIQAPDEVAIATESAGVRIVRLGVRTHPPAHIRLWSGDSIGRWEGDTLVVETTNFHPGEVHKTPQPISITADAKVTEWFRRISPSEILYSFSVQDPAVLTRSWRGELVMRAAKGPVYEYACHEGNYSLAGILAGARVEEKAALVARQEPAATAPGRRTGRGK
uniref:hypothetical protein n=1 Tax=Phenylobacterium sp. TaxID=1871053 RepID=UPI00398341DC